MQAMSASVINNYSGNHLIPGPVIEKFWQMKDIAENYSGLSPIAARKLCKGLKADPSNGEFRLTHLADGKQVQQFHWSQIGKERCEAIIEAKGYWRVGGKPNTHLMPFDDIFVGM
jgi:hypothetical protein